MVLLLIKLVGKPQDAFNKLALVCMFKNTVVIIGVAAALLAVFFGIYVTFASSGVQTEKVSTPNNLIQQREDAMKQMRLIPLTQVRLYVVGPAVPHPCGDCPVL